MKLKRYFLGSFEQSSNKMIATDPCYDRGVSNDIRVIIDGVKPGKWCASVLRGEFSSWGERIAELQVLYEDVSTENADNAAWMRCSDNMVGVDSGQAGLFDESKYPYDNLGEYGDDESFYGRACNITCNDTGIRGGVLEGFGAVSSSGIGDGGYECYVLHNASDEIVGAKIIYLPFDEIELAEAT